MLMRLIKLGVKVRTRHQLVMFQVKVFNKLSFKIIEGTVASVPPTPGRNILIYQEYLEIDTSSILFIAAGAFAGIDQIVKKRLHSVQPVLDLI